MDDFNEDKLYQKIIEPLKKQNITAPDDLWLKVRERMEGLNAKAANPLLNLRLQLATFSFLVIVGVGLFESSQLNPQVQANRYLKENVLQSQNTIFSDYKYFTGTF
jgi:hypothetical protein